MRSSNQDIQMSVLSYIMCPKSGKINRKNSLEKLYVIIFSASIPWWLRLDGDLLVIVIAVTVIIILVMIVVCVIIFLMCRRKHSKLKCELTRLIKQTLNSLSIKCKYISYVSNEGSGCIKSTYHFFQLK